MGRTTITIDVDADSARTFEEAPPEERRKLQALLALRLHELTHGSKRTLAAIMDEASRQAVAAGLTPEILEILHSP